jgi:hypothetical protein
LGLNLVLNWVLNWVINVGLKLGINWVLAYEQLAYRHVTNHIENNKDKVKIFISNYQDVEALFGAQSNMSV